MNPVTPLLGGNITLALASTIALALGLCMLWFAVSDRAQIRAPPLPGINLAAPGATFLHQWTTIPGYQDSRSALFATRIHVALHPALGIKRTTLNGFLDGNSTWCFFGGSGTIGFTLREPDILDHIVMWGRPSVPYMLGSHPREIILWGLVDGSRNHRKLGAHNPPFLSATLPKTLSSAPAFHFVPLAHFEYNDNENDALYQSIPISEQLVQLQVDFGVVVVDIRSNWGGPTTCLPTIQIRTRCRLAPCNS